MSQSDKTSKPKTVYQQAKEESQALLRERLLAVASELLATEGAPALTMRRIAKEAGCSTMLLYRFFESKEGLANELFQEGFERLKEAQNKLTPNSNAEIYLLELCKTYRQVAHNYPTHYAVMFQKAIPEFKASKESQLKAKESLSILTQATQQCIDKKIFTPLNAEQVALKFWATSHGIVSLELSGFMPEGAEFLFESCIQDLINAQKQT